MQINDPSGTETRVRRWGRLLLRGWCRDGDFAGYRLGDFFYDKSGHTAMTRAPRILHRIKLNEHMERPPRYTDTIRINLCESDSGKLFQDRVKEAEASMEHLTPAMARTLRPVLDEIIARHEPSNTAKRLMEEQAARAASVMPVMYRPHTDCGKREVVVPEGYRQVLDPDNVMAGDLTSTPEGFWKPVNGVHAAFAGMAAIDALGRTYIRPIAKPFRVTGRGWYSTTNSGWIFIGGDNENPDDKRWGWNEDGSHNGPDRGLDLIARATAEQAKILDAL